MAIPASTMMTMILPLRWLTGRLMDQRLMVLLAQRLMVLQRLASQRFLAPQLIANQ